MREKTSPLGYYTIGIAALFLLGFLLLIVFGAQVYQDAVTKQDQNNQTRALRSYLVSCVRSAAAGDVELRDGAGTQGVESEILVIRDGGTDYGLQVFLSDGQLTEVYGRLDQDPNPEMAQPIAATPVFDVEQISDEVFAVTTGAGRILLHAGGAGDGAAADEDDTADAVSGGGDAR